MENLFCDNIILGKRQKLKAIITRLVCNAQFVDFYE
jgi:hypothetical protein